MATCSSSLMQTGRCNLCGQFAGTPPSLPSAFWGLDMLAHDVDQIKFSLGPECCGSCTVGSHSQVAVLWGHIAKYM